MTQVFQLALIVAVASGLAIYGHFKGIRERASDLNDRYDPRQPPLFPETRDEEVREHRGAAMSRL